MVVLVCILLCNDVYVCMAIHVCTRFYKFIYCTVWLNKVAYGCTMLYMIVQGSTSTSKILYCRLSLYKVVQGSTRMYMIVQDCT